MKVAMLDPSLFTGRYDDSLCAALAAQGAQVTLLGRPMRPTDAIAPQGYHYRPHFFRRSEALRDRLGDLSGMNAVVIGRSNIVGKPMAQLLLAENATVTIAHSRTHDLASVVHRADIVVAAVGRPEMIKGEWIKPGATVIDVGINRVPDDEDTGKSRIVGDVATAEALAHVGAITPVPGGVGPMTIAVLLRNTLVAAHARAGLAKPDGL